MEKYVYSISSGLKELALSEVKAVISSTAYKSIEHMFAMIKDKEYYETIKQAVEAGIPIYQPRMLGDEFWSNYSEFDESLECGYFGPKLYMTGLVGDHILSPLDQKLLDKCKLN